MQTVAIAGVGLIGGSFGLALRKAGFEGRILGVSSPATIQAAVERGAIDKGVSLKDAVESADLIYLAQPISRILSTIDAIAAIGPRPGSLITDAGSTKVTIVRHAAEVLPPGSFLGGHPMAGKETRGVESASADLFAGRTYVLSPFKPEDLRSDTVNNFTVWIQKIGAIPVILEAEVHDRTVALTSHLPQLASTALACVLANAALPPDQASVAGPGLLDSVRLAVSDYEIWQDIFSTNERNIRLALSAYIDKLSDFRQNLTDQSIDESFRTGADTARKFRR